MFLSFLFCVDGVLIRSNVESPSAKDLDNTGHLLGILKGAELISNNEDEFEETGNIKHCYIIKPVNNKL